MNIVWVKRQTRLGLPYKPELRATIREDLFMPVPYLKPSVVLRLLINTCSMIKSVDKSGFSHIRQCHLCCQETVHDVLIWLLDPKNTWLDTKIMILYSLLAEMSPKLDLFNFLVAILELCKLGNLPLLRFLVTFIMFLYYTSETVGEGIIYVVISGGSFHSLPGL